MATQKGVWGLQQVRDKQLQDLWSYTGAVGLYAWGYDNDGQMGLNSRGVAYSSPVQVPGTNWKYVSDTGALNDGTNAFYITSSGTIWGTGSNAKG